VVHQVLPAPQHSKCFILYHLNTWTVKNTAENVISTHEKQMLHVMLSQHLNSMSSYEMFPILGSPFLLVFSQILRMSLSCSCCYLEALAPSLCHQSTRPPSFFCDLEPDNEDKP
jgi:hypothetical protein